MTDLDLIDTTQALAILDLTATSSVTRMVERGELKPAYKGRVLLFNRADVQALADKRKGK